MLVAWRAETVEAQECEGTKLSPMPDIVPASIPPHRIFGLIPKQRSDITTRDQVATRSDIGVRRELVTSGNRVAS
jgi:hypothetical protein